jgi:hypothetical protein
MYPPNDSFSGLSSLENKSLIYFCTTVMLVFPRLSWNVPIERAVQRSSRAAINIKEPKKEGHLQFRTFWNLEKCYVNDSRVFFSSQNSNRPKRKASNGNTTVRTMSKLQASTGSADASEEDSDESLSLGASTDDTGTDNGANGGMNTTQEDQVKEVQDMAKTERRNMRIWKFVVALTILATAALVSAGTYIFLKDDEQSSFEASYYSFANTIGDAAEVHAQKLFSTLRSASNSMSAAAIVANSEFPFVTVPQFEVLGELIREQSGSEILIYSPKVEIDQVTRWQEYAAANEGWLEESKQLAVSSSDGSLVMSDYAPGRPIPFIFNGIIDEDGNPAPGPPRNPPFYPVWQFSPPPFSPYLLKANIGGVPVVSSALEAAAVAGEGVLGPTSFDNLYSLAGLAYKKGDHEKFHAPFLVSSDTETAWKRPHTQFHQPIFREIYNNTSEVAGYMNAVVPWDRYFANLLPEGVKGITCVASNSCGQSFTYYLDGNKVSDSKMRKERCSTPLLW